VDALLADLAAEQAVLAAVLAALPEEAWDAPTPAPGWAVRDQVAHLAVGEELAGLAAADPGAFATRLSELVADLEELERDQARRARELSPAELREWWTTAASTTLDAVRTYAGGDRIGWITGPMSISSFVTARVMETWAHGHDVVEATGTPPPPPSARLRHIADLGVRTRAFSFRNRGEPVPDAEPHVVLTGPNGERWDWGPAHAAERVEGSVGDFCLVVCRRRHVDDTALRATGPGAVRWLQIAQCFAGPPSDPPPQERANC
jgi:uncharacterized protein (TIGR03084 family)